MNIRKRGLDQWRSQNFGGGGERISVQNSSNFFLFRQFFSKEEGGGVKISKLSATSLA